MEEKTMTTVQLPRELHKWLKREAFERESTITIELAEAVTLLREQRTATAISVTKPARRAVRPQPAPVQP